MERAGILGRIGLVIATGSALLASVAIAQSAPAPGPCPMGTGMMGPGMMSWDGQNTGWGNWMMFHGIFSLLLFLLAIAGIVALFRLGLKPRPSSGDAGNRPAGLDVLERRYASGEIDREEYLQKKADLGG